MHTVWKPFSTSAPYSHSDSGQASIPTSVILSRHRMSAFTNGVGSLSALPPQTGQPSASNTQIEVVLSDTSSPTNMAIAHLPLLGRIGPAEDSEGLESDYPSSRRYSAPLAGGSRS